MPFDTAAHDILWAAISIPLESPANLSYSRLHSVLDGWRTIRYYPSIISSLEKAKETCDFSICDGALFNTRVFAMHDDLLQYTQPSPAIDCNHLFILQFAKSKAGRSKDQREQALSLYYAVRDDIRYDHYF